MGPAAQSGGGATLGGRCATFPPIAGAMARRGRFGSWLTSRARGAITAASVRDASSCVGIARTILAAAIPAKAGGPSVNLLSYMRPANEVWL